MTKVVVTKMTRKKLSRSSRLKSKRVAGSYGKPLSLYVVDSNDDNFDDDLTHVFTLNVAKARQANTALFGSPDGPLSSKKAKKAARRRK